MKRLSLKCVVYMVTGFIGGVIVFNIINNSLGLRCNQSYFVHPKIQHGTINKESRHGTIPPKSNIYLGMMSASKFLTSRVQRNVDTWLQKGGWKVEVFADADSSLLRIPPGLDLNVVTLPTVDDTAYPPQKKSFLLIRHMHDHHINNFDWFIRADDDSYTDFPRLQKFLNTINSSLPIFLGSPGFGMDDDDGMEEGMRYLMGGLGMIFSRGMLIQLRPHLQHCIQHLYSPHEDIEIGRCVWKHTKAITPVAWEAVDLFYQQYEKETGAVVDIKMDQLTPKRTEKTISYHSVKTADLMHKLHNQVLRRSLHEILNRTARIKNEIAHMKQMLYLHYNSLSKEKDADSTVPLVLGSETAVPWRKEGNPWPEGASWNPRNASFNRLAFQVPWLNWDKYYRHDAADPLVPIRGHSKVEKAAICDMLGDIEGRIIKESCGANFPPSVHLNYAYMQIGSVDGVRLMTVHRSSAGSTIKFCRTASQVTYGATLFSEYDAPLSSNKIVQNSMKSSVGLLGRAVGDLLGVRDENEVPGGSRGKFQNALNEPIVPPQMATSSSANHRIIFVIPLQGRYRALEQFMESYERDFLKPIQNSEHGGSNVQLAIVLLGNDDQGDDLGLNRASAHLLRSYQNTYGSHLLRYHVASTGDRSFSRGAGIQLGSLVGEENDILFFMDIDMIVTPNIAAQCRHNIQQGRNAWYPIPYSQYDPDRLCFHDIVPRNSDTRQDLVYDGGIGPVPKESASRERQLIRDLIKQTPLTLNKDRGFWRDFGFGIACMYKSDFIRTGGFDLTIEGWGEEDVRLYVSLIKSGVDVFRARQSDLVHIFHHKYCDANISYEQAKACRRTKASHYASQHCLANMWFMKK